MAKKSRVLEGWTCAKLVESGHVDISPQWEVKFCSKGRHAKCARVKECYMFRPRCESARNHMGKTPVPNTGFDLTKMFALLNKRDRVIHETLKKYWQSCHRVRVTVEELR